MSSNPRQPYIVQLEHHDTLDAATWFRQFLAGRGIKMTHELAESFALYEEWGRNVTSKTTGRSLRKRAWELGREGTG
jgi:hypothetical protein